jgi:hypothetical protein
VLLPCQESPAQLLLSTSSQTDLFAWNACRSALWALFLPSGLPRPVAAVWRSYWAQRLLQDTGGLLQLTLANNKPVNNTNTLSTSKDLQLELQVRPAAGHQRLCTLLGSKWAPIACPYQLHSTGVESCDPHVTWLLVERHAPTA